MNQKLLCGCLTLIAASLAAADPTPKDDVAAATRKLAENGSYAWTTTVENAGGGGGGAGGGRGRFGPTQGKADKDGWIQITRTMGDNSVEAVLKGTQGAIKTADGWVSLAEAGEGDGGGGGGGQNPGRFMARSLQNFKAPPAEAEDLAGKAKELKKTDDAFSGDLTEDAAKELLTAGRRRAGAEVPPTRDAKGSVRFWVKDGVLAKYETHVQGTMTVNGEDREVDRTTTVEFRDVGTTKVEVPEEAKKKLS